MIETIVAVLIGNALAAAFLWAFEKWQEARDRRALQREPPPF